MHELAIAENMLAIAEEELARHGCTKLTLLRAEVGALSGVVADSLAFGFECLVKGTPHEGCTLDIVSIPLKLRCGACGLVFDGQAGSGAGGLGELLPCPGCGEVLGHEVLQGREMRVVWLEGD
ncbi:MAG: hydrogenase maturation nickel metallochaperone HypA [Desulfovibrio sp.]|nr:hydrogenase maturation nickel metallochaperone HypA [Desulfovibrio sp.]